MCGIVGILNEVPTAPPSQETIQRMLNIVRHRGPDQFGIYLDERVGLGHARLSIIDLHTGQQPISNEDGRLWIIFNGEIFNYVELRPALEKRGHRFSTTTDTEVIIHLYEEYGPACLEYLNGQFALAIWDACDQTLFLARDRLGIRPLYYTQVDKRLIFGSEIKSLLATPWVRAEFDPVTLDQIFTVWSPLSPRTIFKGIQEVPPGHALLAQQGTIKIEPYWRVEFPTPTDAPPRRSPADYLDEFEALLIDATRLRLRADVPVGAYLSGGLDSSTTAAIIRNYTGNHLDTFSIAFSDPDFDESCYQRQMADFLGTDHQVVYADETDIGCIFPQVIWHTEAPIMRTAPGPLFLLSRLVRDHHYKVVLTGEGADEFLAGYNIFKEAKIRRFWAQQPDSCLRPLLLKRLYPYIADLNNGQGRYLTAFFRHRLTDLDRPDYSHLIRWHNTGRAKRFFTEDVARAVAAHYAHSNAASAIDSLIYPARFNRWHPLNQAQYLEITIFLSQYLLCSQGDRMGMAHSIEGRFPFLDHRLVHFCNHLPPTLKLRGLTEKYLLKKLAQRWLPPQIWQRPKRPYRAPIKSCFFHPAAPDYVADLLSPDCVAALGLFKPAAVRQLVQKIERGLPLSETDGMALTGILSSHLLYQQFIIDFPRPAPLPAAADLKICRPTPALAGA